MPSKTYYKIQISHAGIDGWCNDPARPAEYSVKEAALKEVEALNVFFSSVAKFRVVEVVETPVGEE